jgi:4-alpha-glucanotransferase
MTPAEHRVLRELARLHGIQASYTDVAGRRRRASPEAILAALRSMGVPVEGLGDVAPAAHRRKREVSGRILEPVAVAWDGRLRFRFRLPAGLSGRADVRVTQDDGRERVGLIRLDEDPGLPDQYGGLVREVGMPGRLPPGYHHLSVTAGRHHAEATVVAAPQRAPNVPRTWGAFLPLYALHSDTSWGVGDLGDLEALAGWVGGLGGGVVATTPLNAAFLDEPFDPGPYSPASRMFWNELFVDISRVSELQASPAAREVVASSGTELRALRAARLVDHRRAMALKRRALEAMLRDLLAEPSERRAALLTFAENHPEVRDYALFRAALERHRKPWPGWPARQREGEVTEADVGPDAYRYHLYAQWLAHQQVASTQAEAARRGVALCLDLPLGCHPFGYDVWRERGGFAPGASAGAPPDAFFAGGQEWGFPPPHPDGIREDGYGYMRRCLRHGLSWAGILRVDHIMAFHRLYWVPECLGPRDGVYVRYRPDELYAVLLLEAHRAGAAVVGEDLGTVPVPVRRRMDRHGIARSFVLQTELGLGDLVPAAGAAASLNTHDMPPFDAFRRGRDIDRRAAEGWHDREEAAAERRRRASSFEELSEALRERGLLNGAADHRGALVQACLADLGAGPAALVVAGLEDLWLESEPQNVPGTVNGSNWRRRARFSLEQIRTMPEVLGPLRALDRARRETSLDRPVAGT